jgi:hypothetical protein
VVTSQRERILELKKVLAKLEEKAGLPGEISSRITGLDQSINRFLEAWNLYPKK